jgi:hypothetical protein
MTALLVKSAAAFLILFQHVALDGTGTLGMPGLSNTSTTAECLLSSCCPGIANQPPCFASFLSPTLDWQESL